MGSKPVLLISLVITAILLLIIGILFITFGSLKFERDVQEDDLRQLGVVIDAGGSGTRFVAYEKRGEMLKQVNYIRCEVNLLLSL